MAELRDYQERAIAEVRREYAAGRRSVLLVAPTGSGKTHIFAEISRRTIARSRRVLVLAHTTELVGQAVRKLAAVGIEAEVEQASAHSRTAPVVVASIASMRGERLAAFSRDAFGLVIHDEAHRTNARTSREILEHFSEAFLLGATATPMRSDQRAMGDAYEALVVGATVRELQGQGHLVPSRVYAPSNVMDAGKLALTPCEAWQRYGDGQRAIVFCSTVEHARQVVGSFAGVAAAAIVHGEMSDDDRALQLVRFARGEVLVLASVNVLVEGFDEPAAAVAILARRMNHVGAYLQAVGRVLRPSPGKTHAIVVDLCGSALVHGVPELEREYSLSGRAISKADRAKIRQCPTCGGVVELSSSAACPLCGVAYPVSRRQMPKNTNVGVSEIDPAKPRRVWLVKLTAKFPGRCGRCSGHIARGDSIVWAKGQRPAHYGCAMGKVAA